MLLAAVLLVRGVAAAAVVFHPPWNFRIGNDDIVAEYHRVIVAEI